MGTLHNRLRALEGRTAPTSAPKRVYSVAGAGTDEEARDFVRSEGWAFDDDADLLIQIVPVAPIMRDPLTDEPIPYVDYPMAEGFRFIGHAPNNPEWRRNL